MQYFTKIFWRLCLCCCLLFPTKQYAFHAPNSASDMGFIQNKGQIIDQNYRPNPAVRYLYNGNGLNVQLRKNGFSYDLYELKADQKIQFHRIDVELVGANAGVQFATDLQAKSYLNYFNELGAFEKVRGFGKVTYLGIYPNIDLEFEITEQKQVKYNFILRRGANPAHIQLKYTGASKTQLENNRIQLQTAFGQVAERIPRSYQADNKDVEVVYTQTATNTFGFKVVGGYDPQQTLTIDPTPNRNWGSYYGGQGNLPSGNGEDVFYRFVPRVVAAGVVAFGRTTSFTNVASAGAFQTTMGSNEDAMIVAMNGDGSRDWATYYGGTGNPEGFSGGDTDAAGNIFFMMVTAQSGLETASTGFETPFQGLSDFLVARFDATGAQQWATYTGGSGAETLPSNAQNTLVQGNYLAVNDAGTMLYVVGTTISTNADVGFSPQQPTIGSVGTRDGYLAQMDATLAVVNWATYAGGANVDDLTGVAIGLNDTVYVCGNTLSTTSANIQGAMAGNVVFDATYTGAQNAFIAKYEPANGLRVWGTYFGNNVTNAWDIATDLNGDCYVVGSSNSNTGIATTGQTVYGGARDGFVVKFQQSGSRLWASYCGGIGDDAAYELVWDNNNVYIGGRTASATGLATAGAYQTAIASSFDGYFAKFPAAGGVANFVSYYGGDSTESIQALTIANGLLYVGGSTLSNTGIATTNNTTFPTHDDSYNGMLPFDRFNDAFIAQFSECSVTATIAASTSVTCNAASTGTATAALTGGVAPITYLWSAAAQTAATATGLAAGIYQVTMTDAGACSGVASVTITQPTAITTSTVSNTSVTCFGASTGAFTMNATGGTSPYQFNRGTGNQATGVFTNVPAAAYIVTITDANACIVTRPITVTQPAAALSSGTTTNISVTCFGASTGSFTVTATGGTSPYQFNRGTGNQATGAFTGLVANTYNVTITDANSCTTTRLVTIAQPAAVLAAGIGSQTSVTCAGASTGAFTITATGGTSAYTFNRGAGAQASGTFTGLAAGNYVVTVLDANSCSMTVPVTITAPSAITSTVSSNTSVTCNGATTGAFTITAGGGTGALSYNRGAGAQASGTFNGLAASSYIVTITDANACSITQAVTVTQASRITTTLSSSTSVTCFGGSNGSLTVASVGGTAPYQFNRGTGNQASASFTGLTAGTYSITVTDANGCVSASGLSIPIAQPSALSLTLASSQASCGSANGSITATVAGGTPTYQYNRGAGNQASNVFGSLIANTYNITVTDANGCTISQAVTVSQPSGVTATLGAQNNVSCFGGSNGSVTITTAGGTTPYQYNRGTGNQASNIFTGLTAGAYIVTVTDANLCTSNVPFTITAPSAITSTVSSNTSVTCNGASTGAFTITAGGGTGALSYNRGTGAQASGTFNGLVASSYIVTITDANACSITQSVTVNQASRITTTLSSSASVTCFGGSNGSLTVASTGGTAPYQFNRGTGNQVSASFVGLTAGTYSITVTDANGCVSASGLSIPIAQPSALSLSLASSQASCGSANGSITATVAGGTAAYQYNRGTGNQVSNVFGALAANIYNITVTDANGCTISAPVTVSQPSGVTATLGNQTNVSCFGGSNGSVTITTAGGTTPYQYNRGTGNQASNIFTGLAAGAYIVTVTDANLCTSNVPFTITAPSAITSTVSSNTSVTCNGASTGAFTITAGGGTGALSYNRGTGAQASGTFNGLVASSYIVTITDANACSITQAVTVNQASRITTTLSSSASVTCFGGSNGSLTVASVGGTAPYQFNRGTGNQASASFAGLTAGTYSITVTDANGCVSASGLSISIAQPSALSLSLASSQASCGSANGSITATVAGGTAAYQYNRGAGNQASNIFGSLIANTYNITVTDANGCTISQAVTVSQPSGVTATLGAQTNVSCFGGSNGSVTITTAGGTTPYQYNRGTGNQVSNIFTGLAAGAYIVTVTDANLCTSNVPFTITAPSAITSTVSSNTSVTCNGASTGAFTITAGGGTGALSYNRGAGAQASNIFSGLVAGSYIVTITDANACSITQAVTVNQASRITTTLSSSASVTCFGGSNGSLTVASVGGTAPYQFNRGTGNQASASFTGLTAGTYSITVTDANGCVSASGLSIPIAQPSALSLSLASSQASCGSANGSITATVAGGTAAYQYNRGAGNQVSNVFGSLAANIYNITVTDANGCTIAAPVTVSQPSGVTATLGTQTNVSCFGGSNGSVTITTAGGTTPYQYNRGTGTQASNIFTGLAAGAYIVTVTDANLCTSNVPFTITAPSAITSTVSSNTSVTCNGASTGAFTITAGGGTGALSYNRGTGAQASGTFASLVAGNYVVTITDANACSITQAVTVTQASAITTSVASQAPATCNGASTGTFTIASTGGTAPYQFNRGTGNQATGAFTGVAAGVYNVTVTDANTCTAVQTLTISQPSALSLSLASSQASCGSANGSITATVSGGTASYQYNRGAGNQASNVFAGVSAGIYNITATDANGCTIAAPVTVSQPSGVSVTTSVTNVTCNGGTTGSAVANATGGLMPYTYLWSNGQTTGTATGLSAINYTLTVTDASGCTAFASVTPSEPAAITVTSTVTNPSCGGFADGSVILTVTGGIGGFTFNRGTGNQPSNVFNGLAAGVYNITTTDGNFCTNVRTVTLTAPSLMTLSMASTNTVCSSNTGTASVSVTGGTSTYAYVWSNAATTANLTGLAANTYQVTVTDAMGCTVTNATTVSLPPAVVFTIANVQNACNGGATGTATATVTSGTLPYSYLWSNSQNANPATGLAANTYTLTVTDANGCTATRTTTITQPSAFVVNTQITSVGCGASGTGAASVTVTGASAPYDYIWSNGRTIASNTGLTVGTYTLTITDANSCTTVINANVTNNASTLSLTFNTLPVSCFGGADGRSTVTAANGTTPYTYVWTNGQTSALSTGLTAGSHTVTVTDANGCSSIGSTTLTQPNPINVVLTVTNASCFGLSDGRIGTFVSGGTVSYTYLWSNGQTGTPATGLPVGGYNLTVTDFNGCSVTRAAGITQPNQIATVFNNVDASCAGQANARASVSVTGGASPYTYRWSNAATNSNISGLAAGGYSVTITDANNCTATGATTVSQPTAVSISVSSTMVSCANGTNGTATATLSGGTTPYTAIWSDGQPNNPATALGAGQYRVTASDANGCTVSGSTTVTGVQISINPVVTAVSCHSGTDGSILSQPAGGTAPYSFAWSNGNTAAYNSNLAAGIYVVTVNDASACNPVITVLTVTQASNITLTATATLVTCPTCADGTASVTAAGGVAPYSFVWSNSQTATTITGLTIGTYFVTITDANGCNLVASANATLVGVEEVSFDDVKVYPNPTQGVLNLEQVPADATIRLVDIYGRVVRNWMAVSGTQTLDISTEPEGMYFIQIEHNRQQHSFKILKLAE
jgi:large repetitive protein